MEKRCLLLFAPCSVLRALSDKRFDERGLANPWLARDEDDLALAVQCFT